MAIQAKNSRESQTVKWLLLFLTLTLGTDLFASVKISDRHRALSPNDLRDFHNQFVIASNVHQMRVFIEINGQELPPKNAGRRFFFLAINSRTTGIHLLMDKVSSASIGKSQDKLVGELKANYLQGGLSLALSQLSRSISKKPNVFKNIGKRMGLVLLLLGLALICIQMAHSKRGLAPLGFGLLIVGWLIKYFDLYFDPLLAFPRDNFRSNYLAFAYVGEYLRQLGDYPVWLFNGEGGMWLDALINNYLLLAPSRLPAYWIALKTNLDLNAIYKVVIILGSQAIFLYGSFRLARKFLEAKYAYAIISLMVISSPLIGTLHQEQDLALMTILPFIWLSFFAVLKNERYLLVLGSLVGLAFLIHYPHILLIYFILVGACSLCFQRSRSVLSRFLHQMKSNRLLAITALAMMIVSCTPTLYLFVKYAGNIKSDFRGQSDKIEISSYADYMKMRAIYETSAYPTDLLSYILGPGHGAAKKRSLLDDKGFFVSPTVLFVLFISILFLFRSMGFQVLLIAGLAWVTLGVYAGAPRALWHIFPGIKLFRQWYHFYPLLNYHLIVLIAAVLLNLSTFKNKTKLWSGVALFALLILSRLVSPLFSIPALAILLGILLIPNKKTWKPKALAFGCTAWMLFGSLPWAFESTNDYTDWSRSLVERGTPNQSEYLVSLFQYGAPFFNVANPRGLGKVQKQQGLQWYTQNGVRLVQPGELQMSYKNRVFQIEILKRPPLTKGIFIHQFNDNNWVGFPPIINSSKNTLAIPLDETDSFISLQRKPTAFLWLRFLCWIPLLLSLLNLLNFWPRPFSQVKTRKAEGFA